MFRRINGVYFREYNETKELPSVFDKRFEMKYYDGEYLNKRIHLDLKYKFTEDSGSYWTFVVKEDDFKEHRLEYAKLVREVYLRIEELLKREYGYVTPHCWILADREEDVNTY